MDELTSHLKDADAFDIHGEPEIHSETSHHHFKPDFERDDELADFVHAAYSFGERS